MLNEVIVDIRSLSWHVVVHVALILRPSCVLEKWT